MTTRPAEKERLRERIATQRPDSQTLETMSAAVVKTFQGFELFQQAKAIGAYMPLPDEVDVTPLFQCLEQRVFIPAFDEKTGSYRMAQYTQELKKGKFGIPEPEHPVWAGPGELDLILVPGVAFDRAGNRLGRGGGFYDRLLPQYRALRIGICFAFQCLDAVPTTRHDVRMDRVVTEQDILHFETNDRQAPGSDIL